MYKNLYFSIILFACGLFLSSPLLAQSDDPCGAPSLPVGTTCTFQGGTNATATASVGVPAPGCASYSGGDVWYTVTVPASGHLIIDSNTGVITDGGMAIYSGACAALTLIECDDDDSANGLMPMIDRTGLTPGATIYVRMWEYGNNNNGTFSICARDGTPGGGGGGPANDDPCSATPLTAGATCSFTAATNAGATASAGVPAPGCASYAGGDVWFSVTVPASGHLIFDTNTGVITDGGMAIYSGVCGALTLIECDDDDSANGLMPMIDRTGLTPGTTIFIRMWEYGNDNNGTFSICVQDGGGGGGGGSAGGASCGTMEPFCTSNTYSFTAQATGTPAEPGNNYGCLISQPDPTWYYFEISQAGNLIFDMTAASDIDFAVWGPYANLAAAQSACGALPAPIDCSFSIAASETSNISGVVVGQVYVLVITNYAGVVQTVNVQTSGANTAQTNCAIVNPPACDADAGGW